MGFSTSGIKLMMGARISRILLMFLFGKDQLLCFTSESIFLILFFFLLLNKILSFLLNLSCLCKHVELPHLCIAKIILGTRVSEIARYVFNYLLVFFSHFDFHKKFSKRHLIIIAILDLSS